MAEYRWRFDTDLMDKVRALVWALRGTRLQTTIRAIVAGGLIRSLTSSGEPPSCPRRRVGRRRSSVWTGLLDDGQVQALYDRCADWPETPCATDLLEEGIRVELARRLSVAQRTGVFEDDVERPERLPAGRAKVARARFRPPRGRCSGCGKSFALRISGNVAHHPGCKGSGRPPLRLSAARRDR